VAYAHVMMWILPSLLVFVLFTQLLRGVSDTLSPLLALMVSTCVGLALTPALIRGWFGLPQLGIQSAAYAGLAGNLAAMAWLAWRLIRKGHPLAPDREFFAALRLDGAILGKVLRIGLPTGVQMIPGVVDCHHRVDPRCAGHRRRAAGTYGADSAHRAIDQRVPDWRFDCAWLSVVALVAGPVPDRGFDPGDG
jgi:hypothetical protein